MERTLARHARIELRGATLRVVGSPDQTLSIGADPRLVGRSPDCHLVLRDKLVSKIHLELRATDRGVLVRDLDSRNGTLYHDARLVEACLAKSAVLQCGDTRLALEPDAPVDVKIAPLQGFGPLIGAAPSMRILYERLGKAARSELSVLVLGETGTGKELVARALHDASPRAKRPFVAVNCAAIAENLVDSELFGHERGAFTGADRARDGLFVEADGGTLFLDELGEMSQGTQAKLLRVLEAREVRPVGGSRSRKVDVRVVAATRRNLARDANTDRFRADLYFRLAQVSVELPPLRDRLEDIPLLVRHLTSALDKGEAFDRITDASLEALLRHDWPGNVRELRSVVAKALAFVEEGPIDIAEYVQPLGGGDRLAKSTGARTLEDAKREYLTELCAETGGNISEMARRAAIGREAVRDYVKKYGLDPVKKKTPG